MYKENNVLVDCPAIPPNLEGPMNQSYLFKNTNLANLMNFYKNRNSKMNIVNDSKTNYIHFDMDETNLTILNQDSYGNGLQSGGYWKPSDCVSRSKLYI